MKKKSFRDRVEAIEKRLEKMEAEVEDLRMRSIRLPTNPVVAPYSAPMITWRVPPLPTSVGGVG